jgi:hypothetical protein
VYEGKHVEEEGGEKTLASSGSKTPECRRLLKNQDKRMREKKVLLAGKETEISITRPGPGPDPDPLSLSYGPQPCRGE